MRVPTDFSKVFEFYLRESQRIVDTMDNPMVLKTDLYNEEQGTPIACGIVGNLKDCMVFGIEYQEDRLEAAKKKVPWAATRMTKGDIRKLEFPDQMFDIVIDLSTIDHVSTDDLDKVFSEYSRVLRKDGILLMCVWTDGVFNPEGEWSPDNQYFFSRDIFVPKFEAKFEVIKNESIFDLDEKKKLLRLVGKKR